MKDWHLKKPKDSGNLVVTDPFWINKAHGKVCNLLTMLNIPLQHAGLWTMQSPNTSMGAAHMLQGTTLGCTTSMYRKAQS